MKINDNTNISLPIRNLVAIIGAVALGVWAYFGVEERLNNGASLIQIYTSFVYKGPFVVEELLN